MVNDCFAHDKKYLLHNEALNILKSGVGPIAETQLLPLEQCHGHILAETLNSPKNIPGFDNSAMDGFAFSHDAYEKTDGDLRITDHIVAGDHDTHKLAAGSAARIFTGAKMPLGADTVAMQEDCKVLTGQQPNIVQIAKGYKKGANVRLTGEDMGKDDKLLEPGTHLRPQELAAIASCGIDWISVYKPLRIALASSGDEIARPGSKIGDAGVYDANFYMLSSLLTPLPVNVTDLGILPDKASAIEQVLEKASEEHDVIITSGGASLGDEDHITQLLNEKGNRHMWQLAIKPGRPVCFGNLNDTVFFGLPGNPVASFVCFLMYIYPSLLRLGGAAWREPVRYQVPSGFDLSGKKTGRREFWRGYLEKDKNGSNCLHKFDRDGSGLITGLRKAQGLIEIDETATQVRKGDMLNFIPFSDYGII